MKIERDRAEILSGIRRGVTLGSPIALMIGNADFKINVLPEVTRPRPGHADLAGALKYGLDDVRGVLERASARETAARVAVGAAAKTLLAEFGMKIAGHVLEIGGARAKTEKLSFAEIITRAGKSELNCVDPAAEREMKRRIEKARADGDSLGGIFEIIAAGVVPGLGSYAHYDRRLDFRLAGALMSVPAVKAVEIGLGFGYASRPGSSAHDEIFYSRAKGFFRRTNNAGGIEGGVSNGEPIVIRGCMKPIPTLGKPLASVDLRTRKPFRAAVERADICAVPACEVIGEAVVAFELAKAFLEKFGGDSMTEIRRNYRGYLAQIGKT